MRLLCHNRILGTLIVAMTLIGWFVLSNHCALSGAAQLSQAKSKHTCCPGGDSKPVDLPPGGGLECCKSLHAPTPDAAKGPDLAPPAFVVATLSFVLRLDADYVPPVVSASDTGSPPGVPSFSELVLHRSLRSHAPPRLA